MSAKLCGAVGCCNDADGTTIDDGRTVHTCLECADKNGKRVELYG